MIVILLTNILKSNTINASIKSVRGTAPLTTQQPIYLDKVLKADRWEFKICLHSYRRRWDFFVFSLWKIFLT